MSTNYIRIGVLDIQGSVEEHVAMLKKCGVHPILVETERELAEIDGLIIPGGESTTITKIMKLYGLDRAICKKAQGEKGVRLPVWGTCAGVIILARLGLIDMEIERNGYGRQLDSFESDISISGLGDAGELGRRAFHAIFIRAPRIKHLKKASLKAEILAEYGGEPVMLRDRNLLATTFHPELTSDLRIHKYFIKIVQEYASKKN